MEFLEILKYTLPALMVFLASYMSLRILIQENKKRRQYEIVMENKKTLIPLRLQAYERMILFLERVSPENLLLRIPHRKLTVKQLQLQLLSAIREEFDHNISQQIYISSKTWKVIKGAKENMVKLINSTAGSIKPEESALKLSRNLIENNMQLDNPPIATAVEIVKAEVRQELGI